MPGDADGQTPANEEKRRLTPEERVVLSQCIRSMTPAGVTQTDSAELIRQDRDSR